MNRYSLLTASAAVSVFFLIVVGGIVRVTGSGMGCPDWPLCEGQVVPPAKIEAWIEVIHRVVAAAVSVFIVASAVFAYVPKRRSSGPWAILAGLALVVQIGLGAITVLLQNSPDSVNIHLLVALVVLAFSTVAAVVSWPDSWRPAEVDRNLARLSLATVIAFFVLVISGAYVFGSGTSLACSGWPLCDWQLFPERTSDQINLLHRFVAGGTAILVVWTSLVAWRERFRSPSLGFAGMTALALYVLQVLAGAAVVLLRLAPPWPALHLTLATASWGSLIILTSLAVLPVRAGDVAGLSASPSESAGPRSFADDARAYLTLTKPVIVLLLLVTTVTSMLVATGGMPPLIVLLATIIGGAFSAGGANAINCFIDRDIDPLMARTRRRGIGERGVPPVRALLFGVSLGVASFVVLTLFVNLLTAVLSLCGLLFYVFVYTLMLKRSTIHNIVIGGAAGSFPPVVGWAAATGQVELPALYLFAIIFFWTPPHFWALSLLVKGDYQRAGIPMLPVVQGDDETRRKIFLYSLLLIPVTLLMFGGRAMGHFYLVSALGLGAVWIWHAFRLLQDRTPRRARALFSYSNGYLALLFAAMVIDRTVAR